MKVWIDGRVVDGDEARVPVTDHGLLYGDGLFEGIRVYGGRVFRLEAHMARFAAGARTLGLELPGGPERMREIVLETARAYAADDAYVRLIATRGDGGLGVDPTTCPSPRVICLADRVSIYPPPKRSRGASRSSRRAAGARPPTPSTRGSRA